MQSIRRLFAGAAREPDPAMLVVRFTQDAIEARLAALETQADVISRRDRRDAREDRDGD